MMKQKYITAILASIGMLILILDAKRAIFGAKDGLELCIYAVIPSLFSFIFLSSLLTSSLSGMNIPFIRPLAKLCGVPKGAESILLIGLLGGYPVGAQSVTTAYKNAVINKDDAHHMLTFCSNAGPAFIFGMLSAQFSQAKICWYLWFVHILSALIVGIVLPSKSGHDATIKTQDSMHITKSLRQSIAVMASICGWIILFRMILTVCIDWFFWLIPENIQILLSGILELSNGCLNLHLISSEAERFVIGAVMLSAGGLCVMMQTASVIGDLKLSKYLLGKLLQSVISLVLAVILVPFVFGGGSAFWSILFLFALFLSIFLLKTRNNSSKIQQDVV